MKRKRIFALIVKFIFCASIIHAQNSVDSSKQKTLRFSQANIVFYKQPPVKNSLSANFYATQLPFFCTKELQIQKLTGFPIKFRLGSVDYCDKMEGKNNTRN